MYSSFEKRLIDLILTLLALPLIIPIFALTSLLVKLKLGSPLIFRQVRPGQHKKLFTLYKFRTMTNWRDDRGNLLPDVDRLTRIGRVMRRISFDELPEILNVLKGEMSLVGPRPLLMQYLNRYTTEQARRHEVRPGITGWAQINGRNAISWEEKFRLDVWYVDHWTFWLDIRIILQTIWKVIKGEGISQPGRATMDEFMGNSEK